MILHHFRQEKPHCIFVVFCLFYILNIEFTKDRILTAFIFLICIDHIPVPDNPSICIGAEEVRCHTLRSALIQVLVHMQEYIGAVRKAAHDPDITLWVSLEKVFKECPESPI